MYRVVPQTKRPNPCIAIDFLLNESSNTSDTCTVNVLLLPLKNEFVFYMALDNLHR